MKNQSQLKRILLRTMKKGDRLCLITQNHLDNDLEIKDDFYEKDREEIKDPLLFQLLDKYEDIFTEKLIGPSKYDIKHHITLKTGAKPV